MNKYRGGRISLGDYLFHCVYLQERQTFTIEFDVKWERSFKENCKVDEN